MRRPLVRCQSRRCHHWYIRHDANGMVQETKDVVQVVSLFDVTRFLRTTPNANLPSKTLAFTGANLLGQIQDPMPQQRLGRFEIP